MQINPPPVHPLPKVDCGELLMETVKAAPILPVRLMDVVAAYVEYQSVPVRMIQKNDSKSIAERLFGNKDKS